MISLLLATVGIVAAGYALNRWVLRRFLSGWPSILAIAASRAVFYGPSIVHLGHGAYLPMPFLVGLYSSFTEVGFDFDPYVFLSPTLVLLGSVGWEWSNAGEDDAQ